ncbi:MAG TPA: hypothetical protein VMM84_02050 [Pyrinomonadaceae bacterium]|nr:hypothetical protein [Pyrinomonadaceae bacterium]
MPNESEQVVEEEKLLEQGDDLHSTEEDSLRSERAVLLRAAKELARHRYNIDDEALTGPSVKGGEDPFGLVSQTLEDSSAESRNAARALFAQDPTRATAIFNQILRESSIDRRREVGAALAGSGLTTDALDVVSYNIPERIYQALAFILLLAKAGQVGPLTGVLEEHPRMDLRIAVVKLLELSGETDVVPVLRNMTANTALPYQVQKAMIEAIDRIEKLETL